MHSVKEQDVMSLQNFDFLALSFAQMHAQGRRVDMEAITGNMDRDGKAWFLKRYDYYLNHLRNEALTD